MSKLYRNFDLEDDKTFDELSEFYGNHVNAMTAEELHSKSSIAWELCYRDNKIAKLQAENEALRLKYENLLEDVQGACGCTDGDDIRNCLSEYLE